MHTFGVAESNAKVGQMRHGTASAALAVPQPIGAVAVAYLLPILRSPHQPVAPVIFVQFHAAWVNAHLCSAVS